jgi:hypothetical protein
MNRQLAWMHHEIHGRWPERKKPRRRPFRKGPPRNWRYRAWIRSLPSCISRKLGCEAAHTGSDGGTAIKASDYSCVPLTPEEHRLYHQIGRPAFERRFRISFRAIVKELNRAWFDFSREVK